MAFFSCKIISVEGRYKIHNGELLAIVEAFKTWKYYLKGSKHEVLICNRLNSITTTRLRRGGDAQREQKKPRATLRDSKNYGIVERCSIDRTLLIK